MCVKFGQFADERRSNFRVRPISVIRRGCSNAIYATAARSRSVVGPLIAKEGPPYRKKVVDTSRLCPLEGEVSDAVGANR